MRSSITKIQRSVTGIQPRNYEGENTVVFANKVEIKTKYEKLFIFLVQKTKYDIDFLKRMPMSDFLLIYEMLKNDKN